MAFLFIDQSIICDNNFNNESVLGFLGKIPGNRRQVMDESPLNFPLFKFSFWFAAQSTERFCGSLNVRHRIGHCFDRYLAAQWIDKELTFSISEKARKQTSKKRRRVIAAFCLLYLISVCLNMDYPRCLPWDEFKLLDVFSRWSKRLFETTCFFPVAAAFSRLFAGLCERLPAPDFPLFLPGCLLSSFASRLVFCRLPASCFPQGTGGIKQTRP